MESNETKHIASKSKAFLEMILALLVFALLTIITTYPLIWHMGNGIYGFPGDSLSTIWVYWRNYQDFLNNNFPSFHCNLLGAPFGASDLQGMLDPHFYEGLLFTILTNEVIAYNLMVMIGILASAFMAYLLSRSLWGSQWGAIVTGIGFGFCPMLAMSAGGHMGFTHLQWLPLYLLSFFHFKRKGGLLSAVLCGIALAIVVVTNFYVGYIAIVATVVFLLCWVQYGGRWIGVFGKWKRFGFFSLTIFIGIILSLPWTWPILRTIIFENVADSPMAQIANRPYHTLFSNSARPWDYILPHVDHPVLGGVSENIYDSLKGLDLKVKGMPGLEDNWPTKYGNWWGQVYVGWTMLLLAFYGWLSAFRWRKTQIHKQERFAIIFLGIFLAVSVWFAMPPEIPIGELVRNLWAGFPDFKIPTPSYVLYGLLPMFRRYMVFGIGTILSAALLAGFGMREFLLQRPARSGKALTIILILSLIFFEFLHNPRHTRFPTIPQEYQWLARQPEKTIMAEYPLDQYRYALFFQRYHGKRMLNAGWGVPVRDNVIVPSVLNLSGQWTAERLGALGVQYVFLHTDDYFPPHPMDSLQFLSIAKPLRGTVEGLRLIKEMPTVQIFEVSDKSALMIAYPDASKKDKRPWLSNTVWSFQNIRQRIYVANAEDKPIKVTLSAKSPKAQGMFRVLCGQDNDDGIKALQWNQSRVLIPTVECAGRGETIIEISFPNRVNGEATTWSELNAIVEVTPISDLVMNGTFLSTCYWEKQAGWSIANGVAVGTNIRGLANMAQRLITTPGKSYEISYTVSNYGGGEVVVSFGGVSGARHRANGTYTEVFKANTGLSFLRVAGEGPLNCHIDNVTCFEITEKG